MIQTTLLFRVDWSKDFFSLTFEKRPRLLCLVRSRECAILSGSLDIWVHWGAVTVTIVRGDVTNQ